MAAMFSQNPLMNGPNYSISDTPRINAPEGAREHRFDPYGNLNSLTVALTNGHRTRCPYLTVMICF